MTSRAIIVAALLSCLSAAYAREKPTSVANAAGAIFGHITSTEALIAHCREVDASHAVDYGQDYSAYMASAFSMKMRVRDVLMNEAKRKSESEDDIRNLLLSFSKNIVDEVKQLSVVNPRLFKEKCNTILSVPPAKIDAVADLRKELPDDMQMIDQWR